MIKSGIIGRFETLHRLLSVCESHAPVSVWLGLACEGNK
jgi:hypothetical protein